MHAVLHLQPDGLVAQQDEALEEALPQTRARGALAHDHRPQLAVVAHDDRLLGAQHQRDEHLRLRRLRALVDEHLAEAERRQPGVARADAGGADHVRGPQDVALHRAAQRLVPLLVTSAQLARLRLELRQLAQVRPLRRGQVQYLVVQRQVLHRAGHRLAALGHEAHHLEAGGGDLLRQLVHRHVGRRRHDDLPLPRQVVHHRGGGDRLPRAGRALHQAQRPREHRLHRQLLTVVQLW